MWQEFIKTVEAKGFDVQLLITYKKDIVDGMTARERALVDGIVDAYLNASVQFRPKMPVPPVGAEKKEEEAPKEAEAEKPEAEPEEKVEETANEA